MKWRIFRSIEAPVKSVLPIKKVNYSAILQLKPTFTLMENGTETESDNLLGKLIGDPCFAVEWQEEWLKMPPKPWGQKPFLGDFDPVKKEQAYHAEIAVTLRVFNGKKLREQEPLSVDKIYSQIAPESIREAFAFALFDLKAPFNRNHDELDDWKSNVRRVVHKRRHLPEIRNPDSILLRHGYQLLDLISHQRQNPTPSLEQLITQWEEFTQTATIDKLPLIFPIVYWGEAAYQLTEIGNMEDANVLVEKQVKAVKELTDLLPNLSDDLKGGLWQHHLGRLAYYRGEFVDALKHYRMEWELQQQNSTLKDRLQRSIASVLSDMGHLSSAKKFAQDALKKEQRENAPDMYKTLGRLGEIHARQEEYAQAIEYFSKSWKNQPIKERDGQTAVYLGHAYLLNGDFTTAKDWYDQADEADNTTQKRELNPYSLMGRIALAYRQKEIAQMMTLWQANKEELSKLRGEKVLPAAVIATAVYLSDRQPEKLLEKYVNKLIDENYLIEAIYPLTIRFVTPSLAKKQLKDIIGGLEKWQQAFEELQGVVTNMPLESQDTNAPTPALLLEAIKKAQDAGNWQALAGFLPRIYPMNLVKR